MRFVSGHWDMGYGGTIPAKPDTLGEVILDGHSIAIPAFLERMEATMKTRSYEEKLLLFKEGKLEPDVELTSAQLKAMGITSNPKNLINVMFEPAVTLGSPTISIGNTVFVGAHSYMYDGGYLRDFVAFGRYCSIGRRVTIGAGTHSMNGISTSPYLNGGGGVAYTHEQKQLLGLLGKYRVKPQTIIGHDVWIGDGAVIMPGVTIGTGSIIGANSVVTRNVEDYSIVAGAPAKPIRRRFPQDVADKLVASKYWELPDELLKLQPLNNVFEFLERLKEMPIAIKGPHTTFPTHGLLVL